MDSTQVMMSMSTAAGGFALIVGFAAALWLNYLLAGRVARDIRMILVPLWALVSALMSLWAWLPLQRLAIALVPTDWLAHYIKGAEWFVIVLLLVGVSWVGLKSDSYVDAVRRRKGRVGERMVAEALRKGGYEALHGQYLVEGAKVTQVDHIAYVGGVILAIETKNYGGTILAKAEADTWTQQFDRKSSSTIPNPLRQSFKHVSILRAIVGQAASGLVVFTPGSEFPGGMPQGVIGLENLVGYLELIAETVPETEQSRLAWEGLKARQAQQDPVADKRRHDAMLSRTAAHQQVPGILGMCRACKGTNVKAAHKHSWYWRCRDCGSNTSMRVPEGFTVQEIDGDVVAKGIDGSTIVVEKRVAPVAPQAMAENVRRIEPRILPERLQQMASRREVG